jgi:hypothetical protein
MNIKSTLVCVAALFNAVASQAATTAVNIDFTTYSQGTAISNLDGVSFGLSNTLDGASLGTPAINDTIRLVSTYDEDWSLIGIVPTHFIGLSNSTTGVQGNPTSHILSFAFDGLASDVSFSFNNFGDSGRTRNNTNVTVFSTDGISTVDLSQSFDGQIFSLSGLSNISKLVFNNNTQNSIPPWLFSISTLKATVVSAVPEPSSAAMLGLGLMALIAVRRRNFY